ncbi:MAG: EamA family transporter [Planctomycetota bacterium]
MANLVLASLLWSVSFALIGAHAIDPDVLAAARLGLAFLLFAPLLRRGADGVDGPQRATPTTLAAIGAVQYGVMYVLVLRAYEHLAGHEVALLTITTPIFVIAVESLLARQTTARAWIAAAIAIAAAFVLRAQDGGASGTRDAGYWTGVGLVQAANVAWAVGQVAYRRVEPNPRTTARRFAWLYLGGLVVAGGWALIQVDRTALALTGDETAVVLYLGLVPSGVAFYLWNRGATRVTVPTLAVMNNLKIPLAVTVALLPPFSEAADLVRLGASFALLLVALAVASGSPRGE